MLLEVNVGNITVENGNIHAGDINIPAVKGDSGKILSLEVESIGVNEAPRVENTGTTTEAKIKLYIPETIKIRDMSIDENYHLIVILNSGQSIDCGYVRGAGIVGAFIRNGILFFRLENEIEVSAGEILSEENMNELKNYIEQYIDESFIELTNKEIEEIINK